MLCLKHDHVRRFVVHNAYSSSLSVGAHDAVQLEDVLDTLASPRLADRVQKSRVRGVILLEYTLKGLRIRRSAEVREENANFVFRVLHG